MKRSAEKLAHILGWLEGQLNETTDGFLPNCVSIQDIFLATHVRFVQARPLGIDLNTQQYPNLEALLDRMDERNSFKANPVWWWEPGVIGYQPDGTPVYQDKTT